jgi:hypothetical protein
MPHRRYLVVVLALVVLGPGRGPAQDRLAPFYSLPADGTWVEYAWKRVTPRNAAESGLLRFSAVGRKEVQGVRCRWVEIKVQARRGDRPKWQIRKLLVPEEAFRKGLPLGEIAVACYHREDGAAGVRRLSPKRIHDFLGMGLGGRDSPLRTVRAKEELTTDLGKFSTRHVATEKTGERARAFHCWLTADVPFGWAKLEIRDTPGDAPARVVFTATATRKGQGAKSEVDETTAE